MRTWAKALQGIAAVRRATAAWQSVLVGASPRRCLPHPHPSASRMPPPKSLSVLMTAFAPSRRVAEPATRALTALSASN